MKSSTQELVRQIEAIAVSQRDRKKRAEEIAEAIRAHGGYRWVGVYDVNGREVSIIAWCGPGAPAFPVFPVTKGLTSSAIREKKAVIVGDVREDSRYLTAFENTLSEIILPVLNPSNGRVIGTIDVESEKANAFTAEDQRLLEACVAAAKPLWNGT
jgi:putative methionine-R-sulfoxide reductase with GAF domain